MTVLAQRIFVCHEHGRVFRKTCATKEHWRPRSPSTQLFLILLAVEFKIIPPAIMVATLTPRMPSTFAYLTL